MRGVTDEELLSAIARRDEASLFELVRRYAPHFRAMISRMTGDEEAAEALLQDALVRVWERAERFDPVKSSARTWLVTLCHRVAVNRLRRAQQLPESDPVGRPSAVGATGHPPAPFEQLDPDARRLFELAFFGAYTHEELADLTGSQPRAVTPILQRALNRLHESTKVDAHDH